MSSILTNTSAMVALQTMRGINANLANTQNQISTGMKVGSAKDNAAIWAISRVMESDVKGFRGIQESLALGESTVAVARNAAETVTDLLTDMKGMIVAAQEENVDREKIQADIEQLRQQIDSVVGTAQFNGLNLVNGDSSDPVRVLASLDRDANGNVEPNRIDVAAQNLTSLGAQFGEGDALAVDAAGLVGAGNDELAATNTATIEFGGASTDPTGTFSFTIGGETLSIEVANGQNAATIAENLANEINGNAALQAMGVSATDDDGDVILAASGTFDDIAFNLSAITGIGGVTGTGDSGNVVATAATVEFTAPEVNAGDSYRVEVDGQEFIVAAAAGDSMGDLVGRLADQINEAGGDFAAQVDTNGNLQVVNTGAANVAFEAEGAEDGRAEGGLFAMSSIDVTTGESAADALGAIERLIDTAIGAASAFGSAQSRIEIQSNFVGNLIDSLNTGIGTLVDADLEEQSARLQALQVQQQLAIQSLSIANQQPQNILALFR